PCTPRRRTARRTGPANAVAAWRRARDVYLLGRPVLRGGGWGEGRALVGQTFLSVIGSASGGHSCPPELIRVRSAGRNAGTRGLGDRQECLSHQDAPPRPLPGVPGRGSKGDRVLLRCL